MFKNLLVAFLALVTVSGVAAAPNCQVLSTFPTTLIAGTPVPVCDAACQTVTPPLCTGSAGPYQLVNFSVLTDGTNPTGLLTADAGYQVISSSDVSAGTASGLANDATVYTATITVDGVAKPISVIGSNAQTIGTLISEINTDLGASAVAAIVSNRIRVTSATTGSTSTVSVVDTDLFSSISGFIAVLSAVPGVTHVYTAVIDVNGTNKNISIVGSAAQTFTTLVSEINADIGTQAIAVLDVPNKQIRITSLATAPTATIAITPGTLFAPPLANYTSLSPVIIGGIPSVSPTNTDAIGDYTNVTCSNIATFPKVTHGNIPFPKCVQKCQAVRPPKCVDYNKELY